MKANPLHMILAVVVVLVVGVVMAVSGFSRDTFMGLLLLAAGFGLVAPNIKNVQSPPPGTGRGAYIFMFAIAALLVVAGLFVLIHGIPE
jgi:hypothetical protein